MLVVVSIMMILMTLIIATVVSALGAMRASGGASGLAGFLRDAQVHAVRTGHVVGVRADRITPVNGDPAFWQLTAWEFPTDADAYLQSVRGTNAANWPPGTAAQPYGRLPAASFDLDPRQDLTISDTPILGPFSWSVPDNISLQSILLLPDATANRNVTFYVGDRTQALEGNSVGTKVQLQGATGRVYLQDVRHEWNP